jgi:hypothetical protein
MFILLNAQERTGEHIHRLLQDSGWKVEKVQHGDGAGVRPFLQTIVASPMTVNPEV